MAKPRCGAIRVGTLERSEDGRIGVDVICNNCPRFGGRSRKGHATGLERNRYSPTKILLAYRRRCKFLQKQADK